MQKLPYSEPSFKSIRREGLFYLDKTREMYQVATFSKYVFLSRPRRFGKSMLISTLSAFYEGKKELFKGLWIEDKVEWESYGVIHIDFSRIYYHSTKEHFQSSFTKVLSFIAEKYNIEITSPNTPEYLDELIQKLYLKTQKPIVILIDEYDKPITSFLVKTEEAIKRRDWLREYYAMLKPHSDHIKQIVITGISKYAKTAIFSELNNVKDITLLPEFNNVVGFTQKDIEDNFAPYIDAFLPKTGWTRERLLEEIALWYDGYSWDGIHKIYNPFSIINLMGDQTFRNYWFKSGTPRMLVDFIIQKVERGELENDIELYENYETDVDLLDSADVRNINLHSLLFQTGYLTIKSIKEIFTRNGSITDVALGFPNQEVRRSMTSHILEAVSKIPIDNIVVDAKRLRFYLISGELEKFMVLLRRFFALIPYQLRENADEACYHSLFQMVLTLIGVRMDAEKPTDKGRIDGVIEFAQIIYIIEFKYGKKGTMEYLHKQAFKQMKEKRYAESYQGTGKPIQFLAIGFLEKKKDKKGQKMLEMDYCLNDKPEYPAKK